MAKKDPTDLTVEEKLKALYQLQVTLSGIDENRELRGELPLEVQDLEDDIAGLTAEIGRVRHSHQTAYTGCRHIVPEGPHIDPGQRGLAGAVPVPACLIATVRVHGNTAGSQHLGAEVHAVPAVVVVSHEGRITLSHPGEHISPGRVAVIGVVGSGCHAQSLAGQVAAGLYVVGDSGKILVLMGGAVIVIRE